MLFYLIPASCVPAVGWLLRDLGNVHNYRFVSGPVSVTDHDGPPWLQLHQLLYEGICTVGVSAAILTAGMAIAGPLYQGVWQGMSDSLFALHQQIVAMLKDEKRSLKEDDRERLRRHCRTLENKLGDLENRVGSAHKRFQFTLRSSAVLLFLIIVLIAIPREGVLYVGAAVITCLSISVGLMIIHLIYEITRVGPASIRLTIQSDIAKIEG